MMTDKLKAVLIWVGAVVGTGVLIMAGQFWISTEVASQLAAAGIVPQADVDALGTRVNNLEKLHDKDVTRVENKAERIAQILMED